MKNKYEQLESEYRAIKQQVEAKSKEPEPEEEVFPDPPPPPQKPYGYSYQEAMSDPSSDSARYMIAMSEYNQNMNQYNLLRTQWVEARNQESLKAFKEQSEAEKKAMQQRSQMSEQVNQVISTVQQKFGVDYNVALDFVNTMSDNSSITVDNLFELYKMKKGIAQGQEPNGALRSGTTATYGAIQPLGRAATASFTGLSAAPASAKRTTHECSSRKIRLWLRSGKP